MFRPSRCWIGNGQFPRMADTSHAGAAALRPLNAAVPAFDALSPDKRYQARLAFYPTVDFLTGIEGVSFALAWTDAVEPPPQLIYAALCTKDSCNGGQLTNI